MEARALTEDQEQVNGVCNSWTHRKSTVSAQTGQECTCGGKKALKAVTRFHAALGLAAVLFIVNTGLVAYVIVLKRGQCSEQSQTTGPQSSVAADGEDGEVLPPCGDDWIWYRNKCFYFSEAEGNWTVAKDSCAALDSSLALIDTQKELNFMIRFKGLRDHWIGLQRETDQPWKWVNGTEFSNCARVESADENCIYLRDSVGKCDVRRR